MTDQRPTDEGRTATGRRDEPDSGTCASRRGVLAGVAGLGMAGLTGLSGTASGSVDNELHRTTTMTFSNHDHSGQNGARNVLGADAPVRSIDAETINATRYASAFGSDGQAIQDAIDDAPGGSAWSRIVVDPIDSAPYVVGSAAPIEVPSKTVVVLREDIELADSTAANIFQNANFDSDATDDTDIAFVGEGGTLDGNRANQSVGGAGSRATGFYQNGISILGAERVLLSNVTTAENQIHGINFAGVRHARVESCETIHNYYSGIHVHFRESDDARNEHIVIDGNVCRDGGQAASHGAGIFISGSRNVTIDGNLVRNRDNHGIGVFAGGSSLGASNVSVTGNTVVDVGAASGSAALGRGAGLFAWTSGSGSGVENVTFANNTVDTVDATDNNQSGIYCLAGSEPIQRVSITGNTVKTQGNAIFLEGSDTDWVRDFSIVGNDVTTTGSIYAKGIAVKDSVYGSVTGNVAKDCQGSGVILWEEENVVSNVVVNGNVCNDGGNASFDAAGIRLYGANDCTVVGNRCTDTGVGTQAHGIREEQGASANVYLCNDLRSNASAGTDFSGGSAQITDPVNQDTTEDYNVT